MGIYDREYYRRETSYIGAWANTGQVCKWLVGINLVVYLLQLVTFRNFQDYGFVTEYLSMKPLHAFYGFQIWRFLTGAFLHNPDNFWHIIWNMAFLWFFGRDMEDRYGHREFLAFYLVAGIVANFFWGLTELLAAPGFQINHMAIGASGAVMAVMVLCTLHHPYRTIYLMFVLPVPLWAFTLVIVAGDLFYFLRGVNLGVAVAGHLGGAGFAFLYYHFQWHLTGLWSDFVNLASRSRKPRVRVYREEPPVAVGSQVVEPLDEQLEAKTDAVLAKLAREGMDKLTAEERDILQRASEQYRKRRS